VSVIPPLANSDHSIVFFSLYICLPQSSSSVQVNNVARPNFSKADWPGLCNFLSTVDWLSEFMCCKSVYEYWDTFLEIISVGIEQFVPNYTNTTHVASTKWYPCHIRTLFAKKKRCWQMYKRFKTTALHDKYKLATRLCTKAVSDHVASAKNDLINDGRIGRFYNYVNKKLVGSNGIAPLRNSNGDVVYSDNEKATLLNNYFGSVFTTVNGIIDRCRIPNKISACISPVFFTSMDVSKCIQQLKPNGSAGPDNIRAEFYKATSSYILLPLSAIFNVSLQTGELPDVWKCASVTPSDPANYRPISLACVACQLLGSDIKANLLNHLLVHNVVNKNQHGFLRRKSTTTQLLECCCDWQLALNSHSKIYIIYLDFAKAFDYVVPCQLIAKLECYGVDAMLLVGLEIS